MISTCNDAFGVLLHLLKYKISQLLSPQVTLIHSGDPDIHIVAQCNRLLCWQGCKPIMLSHPPCPACKTQDSALHNSFPGGTTKVMDLQRNYEPAPCLLLVSWATLIFFFWDVVTPLTSAAVASESTSASWRGSPPCAERLPPFEVQVWSNSGFWHSV